MSCEKSDSVHVLVRTLSQWFSSWSRHPSGSTGKHLRAGPTKVLPERWIGHALLNITNVDAIFWHRVYRCTNQQLESLPEILFYFIFVVEIRDRYNDPKKCKSDSSTSSEKKGRTFQAGFPFVLHVRFEHEFKLSDGNSQNWAGHRRNNAMYDMHDGTCFINSMESFCCYIYWCVMNWLMQLTSIILCLQHCCLHQFSPWSGTAIFLAVIRS